jgi:hypothetical protein
MDSKRLVAEEERNLVLAKEQQARRDKERARGVMTSPYNPRTDVVTDIAVLQAEVKAAHRTNQQLLDTVTADVERAIQEVCRVCLEAYVFLGTCVLVLARLCLCACGKECG